MRFPSTNWLAIIPPFHWLRKFRLASDWFCSRRHLVITLQLLAIILTAHAQNTPCSVDGDCGRNEVCRADVACRMGYCACAPGFQPYGIGNRTCVREVQLPLGSKCRVSAFAEHCGDEMECDFLKERCSCLRGYKESRLNATTFMCSANRRERGESCDRESQDCNMEKWLTCLYNENGDMECQCPVDMKLQSNTEHRWEKCVDRKFGDICSTTEQCSAGRRRRSRASPKGLGPRGFTCSSETNSQGYCKCQAGYSDYQVGFYGIDDTLEYSFLTSRVCLKTEKVSMVLASGMACTIAPWAIKSDKKIQLCREGEVCVKCGEREGQEFSGVCSVGACGPPPAVKNGQFLPARKSLRYTPGSKIMYRCYSGFNVTGNAELRCLPDGSWPHPPICDEIFCGPPPGLEYAVVETSDRARRSAGATVRYRCLEGYELSGSAAIVCRTDGRWSSTDALCNVVSSTAAKRDAGDSGAARTGGYLLISIFVPFSQLWNNI